MASINWGNIWEQTKQKASEVQAQALEQAKKLKEQADQLNADEVLEAHGINALLGRAPQPGDPQWGAAVSALDLTYITDRVIAMAMPFDRRAELIAQAKESIGGDVVKKKSASASSQGNNIDIIASLLQHRHAGHYMVWNVSEEQYDYSKFSDQVLEFKFPGHPAPPLGLLFKICTSLENWLDADPMNVAVMHCLTGKGRTATILACFLCWSGEFASVMEALQYIAQKRNDNVEKLTIPSQRRYLQYFSNMLDGVKPRSEPLLLRRVIMNTVPKFGTQLGGVRDPALPESALAGNLPPGDPRDLGCCPYIQLFKAGKLVFTATWTSSESKRATAGEEGGGDVAWCYPSDQSVGFTVDTVLQGDVLVRCRHLTPKGSRISMFRAAFHTGYVPCGVLRLNKAQLDGACTDPRFDDDFFLDLIFAPVTTAPKAGDKGDAAVGPNSSAAGGGSSEASQNSASERRERGIVVEPEARDAYDAMLHRDTRFWEEIAARKERATTRRSKARMQRQMDLTGSNNFAISDGDAGDATDDAEAMMSSGPGRENPFMIPGSLESLEPLEDARSEASAPGPRAPQLAAASGLAGLQLPVVAPEAGTAATAALLEQLEQLESDGSPLDGSPPGGGGEPPLAASTAAPAAAPLEPPPEGLEIADELAALAELEKELGLVAVATEDGSQSSPSPAAAQDPEPTMKLSDEVSTTEFDDEALEDFEGYLESLTKDVDGGGSGGSS